MAGPSGGALPGGVHGGWARKSHRFVDMHIANGPHTSAAPGSPRRRPAPTGRAAALLGVGVAATLAFAFVARASARRKTEAPDEKVHAVTREELETPAGEVAEEVAPAVDAVGKWWIYTPAAGAVAAAILTMPSRVEPDARRRRIGAGAVMLVPGLVSALSPLLDRALPQPPVWPRRRPVDHPVFPSGHAFRVTAIASMAAFVATREAIASPSVAWPVAALASVTIGASRLVREKHLASDVVGGWLAGGALAALAAAAVEHWAPVYRDDPRHAVVDDGTAAAATAA